MTAKQGFRRPAAAPSEFVESAGAPVAPVNVSVELAPWMGLSIDVPVYTNYKMSKVTHAKMLWIRDNVPKLNSMQKIIDSFVLEGLEKLIQEHYKP